MRNKREYTEEELAWAKTLIKPELPEYDEKDHEIAKLRFILHEVIEEFSDVWFTTGEWAQENMNGSWIENTRRKFVNWWWKITGKKCWKFMSRPPLRTMDEVHKALGDILFREGEMNIPDGTSKEDIDRYASDHNWEDFRHEHVEGFHCGDCTAVACSCLKCFAEQFYGFKTPYEGKQAGSKALAIYMSWLDDQKAAEEK